MTLSSAVFPAEGLSMTDHLVILRATEDENWWEHGMALVGMLAKITRETKKRVYVQGIEAGADGQLAGQRNGAGYVSHDTILVTNATHELHHELVEADKARLNEISRAKAVCRMACDSADSVFAEFLNSTLPQPPRTLFPPGWRSFRLRLREALRNRNQ